MSLLTPLFSRVTDSSGRPVAYALVSIFAAGTTTKVEVFADSDLTTPLLNPVMCGGPENPGLIPAIFVDAAARLRVQYADALGVILADFDDIEAIAVARTIVQDIAGANHVYTLADIGRITRRTNGTGMLDTLSTAAAVGNGAVFTVINDSPTLSLTLQVSGGGTIDGAATLVLRPGSQVTLISDGTQYTKRPQPLGFGDHTQSLPAGFWEARPTNPAVYGVKALATNNIAVRRWSFSDSVEQGVSGRFTTPLSWDGGPFWAQIKWQSDVLLGSIARFAVRARALGNSEDINQPYGAAATIDDASYGPGTSGDGCEMITDWFLVTPAAIGTVNGGKTLALEVSRPVLAGFPHLLYITDVVLRLNLNRENDNP